MPDQVAGEAPVGPGEASYRAGGNSTATLSSYSAFAGTGMTLSESSGASVASDSLNDRRDRRASLRMGKAPSPLRRGPTHGPGASATLAAPSGTTSSSGNNELMPDELLLAPSERPDRVESTVVSRENATHLAFARSRKDDFVYAASSQYLRVLNDHCSAEPPSDHAPLLVVVGQPGDGKSALLAHWAESRRLTEAADGHEFIYEHYSGCSFDSIKLSLLLFRFMNQIKVTFGLRDFELPHEHDEERLKFSFARCLEAAVGRSSQPRAAAGAKRKKIILIVDGIDCIRTEDGGDSLSWLPMAFPAGVRIIVSATHSLRRGPSELQCCRLVTRKPFAFDDDADLVYDTTLPAQPHDSHTIRELRRRRATFLAVEPLDDAACRALLDRYEGVHGDVPPLSPDEREAILGAPGSSSPLYIRLLLHGLELFAAATPSARRQWLESATATTDFSALYGLLMQRWNDILLHDQMETLRRMQHSTNAGSDCDDSAQASHESPQERRISRRGTKRDVTDAVAVASTLGHPVGPDAAEIEAMFAQIEQRALLVRHTLSLLASARYGLSESDVLRLIGDVVPKRVVLQLLTLLRPHLLRIRRRDCGARPEDPEVVLLDLSHNQLRLLVRYGFLGDDALRTSYFKELAGYFDAMGACQRRVDELPVQLERCGMWSALQSALVDISMFQLWWSERNRQDFVSYWTVLRANGALHDPVDDFVRALDDFIVRESPTAEQLLALFLQITEFLRAWQRILNDSGASGGGAGVALHRPPPPQLQEFITSLGTFSTAHLSERDARIVQLEIEALGIHDDDGYYVRRWLWTQFPLIGIAFESRFLRSLLTNSRFATAAAAGNGGALQAAADAGSDADSSVFGGGLSSSGSTTSSMGAPSAALPPAASHSKAATSLSKGKQASAGGGGGVSLPKAVQLGSGNSSKKKPAAKSRKEGGALSPLLSDSLSPPRAGGSDEAFGSLEFLSAESAELTVGSVSKLEAQLVELRMRYDKLKFAAKARQDAMRTLDSRLLDARASAKAADQGAAQIETLLEQIRAINDETLLGRQRSDYYKAVLRHCEVNPARDPNTIDSAEIKVNRMRQDIVELAQKTQLLSYENRLATVEIKKMQAVIEDKAEIHRTALERLRWRRELALRVVRGADDDVERPTDRARRDKATDNNQDAAEAGSDDEASASDGDESSPGKRLSASPTASKAKKTKKKKDSVVTLADDVNFSQAKEKLLQKKETTLERAKKSESLKIYLGSPYKDDGLLGALRQVGINRPEEADLYWQDQQQHAAQLEAEERNLEQRVAEYRARLEAMQSQLLNLKLGGSSSNSSSAPGSQLGSGEMEAAGGSVVAASTGGSSTAASAPSSACGGAAAGAGAGGTGGAGGGGAGGGGGGGGGSTLPGTAQNMKQLDQQLAEAKSLHVQKKERTTRLHALHERLRLGLLHVAHVLGVSAPQQMNSVELVDAVEQVVRLYLGDEGHLQTATGTNLRRKNSVRAMGLSAQSGGHSVVAPDARSPDEKVRFNVRVSTSPQRQMNPYVSGENPERDCVEEDDEDDDEEEDDSSGDGRDAERDRREDDTRAKRSGRRGAGGGWSSTRSSPRRRGVAADSEAAEDVAAEDAVTRRSDIKNRSRLEVERKRAPHRKDKQPPKDGDKTAKERALKRLLTGAL
ncbi:hypothetical protein ATCC90586_002231 [Pythium insidiosum]|nr:hypothetical protein ATCC90586_002231 [Pythium insidiosum]